MEGINIEQLLVEVLIAAVLVYAYLDYRNSRRAKRVLVVEDSREEIMMMKVNLCIPNTLIEYVDSLKDVSLGRLWYNAPDLVIVDYHLGGTRKGVELLKHCEACGIPAKLITADSGQIVGVPEYKIIRKRVGEQFYRDLSNWAKNKLNIA